MALSPLQTGGGLIPRGTRVQVFQDIYILFLILGTVVGVIVMGYMIYNAYKYRASREDGKEPADSPEIGEIPQGSGGGKKLLLSFSLSAIIVISLIVWTYGTLLYVEQNSPVDQGGDHIEIEVTGYQFNWDFTYENGHKTTGELRVPKGTAVKLKVTSNDVMHNFGVPGLRVKVDAIPGQQTTTWFEGDTTGTFQAKCYELCGAGHSYMNAEIRVMPPAEFESWYANTSGS